MFHIRTGDYHLCLVFCSRRGGKQSRSCQYFKQESLAPILISTHPSRYLWRSGLSCCNCSLYGVGQSGLATNTSHWEWKYDFPKGHRQIANSITETCSEPRGTLLQVLGLGWVGKQPDPLELSSLGSLTSAHGVGTTSGAWVSSSVDNDDSDSGGQGNIGSENNLTLSGLGLGWLGLAVDRA